MAAEEMTALWERLHADPRHQLRYPSEHVVRWLSGLGSGEGRRALDIGCGHGRHMRLFEEFGYAAFGLDSASNLYPVSRGEMTDLPWRDEQFDIALAFGVFYYGTLDDHRRAARELWRVLKPGGRALVVARTEDDSRSRDLRVGDQLDGHTVRIMDGDEEGMLVSFLARNDVTNIYAIDCGFSRVDVELTETTRDNQRWRDSDWLISVTK